jgi:hypothetical protein
MPFKVSGPFPIKREGVAIAFGKNELAAFWEQVEETERGACGCYVFALQNGDNIVPWYVGKAEKATFEHRCFDPRHLVLYSLATRDRKGKPLLFLLSRRTPTERFSKPGTKMRDIMFLENMLIGMALRRNPDLLNVQQTSMLKEMVVPGVINTPQGKPTGAETQLRQALGISNGRRRQAEHQAAVAAGGEPPDQVTQADGRRTVNVGVAAAVVVP